MLPRQRQETIRRKLADGDLPTNVPVTLEVRRGTGVTCDACGGRIGVVEIEHEFTYHSGRASRLHFDCAALWMDLRRQARRFALAS